MPKKPSSPTYQPPVFSYLTQGELGKIDFEKVDPNELLPLVFDEIKPEEYEKLELGTLKPDDLKPVLYQRLGAKGLTQLQLKKLENLEPLKLARLELDSVVKGQQDFTSQKAGLKGISQTVSEANRLDDEAYRQQLEAATPGILGSVEQRLKTTTAMQKGELDPETRAALMREAAQMGRQTGMTASSGAQANRTLRDLGLASRDAVREGDQRALQDRELAESLIAGKLRAGDQLLGVRELLGRRDQQALFNTQTQQEEDRDRTATARQITLANTDLENEMRRTNTGLENQQKLFDLNLTNAEKEQMANLANQTTLFNIGQRDAMTQYNTGLKNQALNTNLALRNQAIAANTAGLNAAYLGNVELENRQRLANLGFRQQETLTNLNIKNNQAQANANAANMTAQAKYENDVRYGGSPFGAIFGGLLGAGVGAAGIPFGLGAVTMPLGASVGGQIGGAFGGAQGGQMGNLFGGLGSSVAGLGMLTNGFSSMPNFTSLLGNSGNFMPMRASASGVTLR